MQVKPTHDRFSSLSTKNLARLLRVRLLEQERCRHLEAEAEIQRQHRRAERDMRNEFRAAVAPLSEVRLRGKFLHDQGAMQIAAVVRVNADMMRHINPAAEADILWTYLAQDMAAGIERQLRILGVSGLVEASRKGEPVPDLAWPYREL